MANLLLKKKKKYWIKNQNVNNTIQYHFCDECSHGLVTACDICCLLLT